MDDQEKKVRNLIDLYRASLEKFEENLKEKHGY